MRKRILCKCPHCGYTSGSYRKVSLHLQFVHPTEDRIVKERYFKLKEEV